MMAEHTKLIEYIENGLQTDNMLGENVIIDLSKACVSRSEATASFVSSNIFNRVGFTNTVIRCDDMRDIGEETTLISDKQLDSQALINLLQDLQLAGLRLKKLANVHISSEDTYGVYLNCLPSGSFEAFIPESIVEKLDGSIEDVGMECTRNEISMNYVSCSSKEELKRGIINTATSMGEAVEVYEMYSKNTKDLKDLKVISCDNMTIVMNGSRLDIVHTRVNDIDRELIEGIDKYILENNLDTEIYSAGSVVPI